MSPRIKEYRQRGTIHYTVRSKGQFTKFRTHDIGRPKHTVRVAGFKRGKWATQKYIFRRTDVGVRKGKLFAKTPSARRTLAQIKRRRR